MKLLTAKVCSSISACLYRTDTQWPFNVRTVIGRVSAYCCNCNHHHTQRGTGCSASVVYHITMSCIYHSVHGGH